MVFTSILSKEPMKAVPNYFFYERLKNSKITAKNCLGGVCSKLPPDSQTKRCFVYSQCTRWQLCRSQDLLARKLSQQIKQIRVAKKQFIANQRRRKLPECDGRHDFANANVSIQRSAYFVNQYRKAFRCSNFSKRFNHKNVCK